MKKIISLFLMCSSFNVFASYERIVVVGGPITEIIKDLGMANKIVGIDLTSTVVEGFGDKPNLGISKKINAESVISLKPDLFIYGENSKNDDLLTKLKAAKVNVVNVPEENNLESINKKIKQISDLLGTKEQAKVLMANVDKDIAELNKKIKPLDLKVAFIYARGGNHLFLAGSDTPAHGIFEYLGVKNAFSTLDGFKPISSESLITGNPEYLVMLSSGVQSLDNVWDIPGLSHTVAGKNKRLVEVDTLPFLGFIPRTPKHMMELVDTLAKVKK